MRKINNLLVITEGFPNINCPYRYTFLEQAVTGFAKKSINVVVICPVYHTEKKYYYKEYWEYTPDDGNTVKVFQPIIINYSVRKIGPLKLGKVTYNSFRNAVFTTVQKYAIHVDAVYSHFMFPSGCVAAQLGDYLGVDSFCACGESSIDKFVEPVGEEYIKNKFRKITGIISVSSENKRIITEKGLAPDVPIAVLPNGIDHNLFYPRNKKECRKKFGLSDSDFVGIFVGGFNENKGIKRVEEAVSTIPDLKMIYIGANGTSPTKGNIVFSGKVSHESIPDYLCCADFFVLPTRAEGCCNAILEAMACGLPIISSDKPFNYDVLSKESAVLIDPDSIDQIRHAIEQMKDKAFADRLKEKSIDRIRRFRLDKRVDDIVSFMENPQV